MSQQHCHHYTFFRREMADNVKEDKRDTYIHTVTALTKLCASAQACMVSSSVCH